ncbi:MAG TPA: ABC transporter substrate-binding protein [Xanthobacteraceae bacterium]|jgi:NitT/TauT family transport system substrate-binding protein
MKLRQLTSLLALVLTCVAAHAQTPIHIALVRSVSNGAELTALDRGYFKDAGLDVVIDDIDTSADTMVLLAQNKLQIIAGGVSAGYFNAVAKGLPITIIADRVSTPIRHDLMIRPDLKDQIKDVKDLKGRVVASNGVGSVSTYETGKILETAGLKVSDVDIKVLRFPQMGAALANKAIDAALLIPPFVYDYAEQKFGVAFAQPDKLVQPSPMTIAVIIVNTDWAKQNHDALQAYVTAYLRGVRDYCNAYHDGSIRKEMIESIVRHGSERNPKILNEYPWPSRSPDGRVNVASMLDMQRWYVANKFSTASLPAERLVDASYAEAAVKKLGPFVLENKASTREGCR